MKDDASGEKTELSPFEAFVAAILKVPKDTIKEVEGARLKRASPKAKHTGDR